LKYGGRKGNGDGTLDCGREDRRRIHMGAAPERRKGDRRHRDMTRELRAARLGGCAQVDAAWPSESDRLSVSPRRSFVACHEVFSQLVPVVLVGECSIPVV